MIYSLEYTLGRAYMTFHGSLHIFIEYLPASGLCIMVVDERKKLVLLLIKNVHTFLLSGGHYPNIGQHYYFLDSYVNIFIFHSF